MKYNKILTVGTVCTAGINIVSCGTQPMSSSKGNTEKVVDPVLLEKADQGDAEAQYWVANQFIEEGNFVEAARYYKLAADQGLPKGQFGYGKYLQCEIGVSRNYEEAARYFKLAADKGHDFAQYEYGECLLYGRGVPQDPIEAARHFAMAAVIGTPYLQDKAVNQLKKLVDTDLPEAQYQYGICLRDGRGVPRNLGEAVRYIKMAADQGHAKAQFNYGVCLRCGAGVGQNDEEAAEYIKMAADLGYALAQYQYGTCLRDGEGVGQDLTAAASYFRKAAESKDPSLRRRAKNQLQRLRLSTGD